MSNQQTTAARQAAVLSHMFKFSLERNQQYITVRQTTLAMKLHGSVQSVSLARNNSNRVITVRQSIFGIK